MAKGGKRAKRISTGILAAIALVAIYLLVSTVTEGSIQYVYSIGMIGYSSYFSGINAASSVSFAIAVFVYLVFYKRESLKKAVGELRLSKRHFGIGSIAMGILMFLAILALEFVIALYSTTTGTTVNSNIGLLLSGATLWVYLFTAFIAPVCEEIMFRGFLVPRIGIVLSAVIFGTGHLAYMSTSYVPGLAVQAVSAIVVVALVWFSLFRLRSPYYAISVVAVGIMFIAGYLGIEVISALVFGLIAGYVFKRTKSLYPSITAHILVNSLAVIVYVYGVGGGV
ncbi:MAG: CPBP family intramembrane metalloprotease [Candidatus Micrarchaeota archaeon]|nr:CPBP family intramembrane metalloprotease [Candidatus Micrarchaeota archaeon]